MCYICKSAASKYFKICEETAKADFEQNEKLVEKLLNDSEDAWSEYEKAVYQNHPEDARNILPPPFGD